MHTNTHGNVIMERMFKERLQKTIVLTSVLVDGFRREYFLTYIEDEHRCHPEHHHESDYCVKCLDNITNKEMIINLKDVLGFEETELYLTDPAKDKEIMIDRLSEVQSDHKAIMDNLASFSHDELYMAAKSKVLLTEGMDKDQLYDDLVDYYVSRQSIDPLRLDEWYYKEYLDIDPKADLANEIDKLKSIWKEQLSVHKQLSLDYLDREISKCGSDEEKDAVREIRALVENEEFDSKIDSMPVDELIAYWPSILLPAPAFVRRGSVGYQGPMLD